MDRIRFGIIGTGKIARKMANTLRWSVDAELIAIASRDKQKAKDFAAEFSINNSYGSYEDLAKDPNVDVVYIATPHTFHFENTILCLEQGKHVLVEKPIAVNGTQARQMFSFAEKKGLFLMEAMWTKFLPGLEYAMDLIKKGNIGNVVRLSAEVGFKRDARTTPRQFLPELAGGALLDIGIYCLTIAAMVFGHEPEKMVSSCIKNIYGTDQQDTVVLQYSGDRQAVLSFAFSAQFRNTAEIYGTQGIISLPRFATGQKVILHQTDEPIIEIPFVNRTGGFEYEVSHIAKCISEGKTQSNIHTKAHTLAILDQMDSLRKEWGLCYPSE
jgi:dihydrodiol dehydrogenase / D-xylose 1-dehydrogenase (NADP)